MELASKAIRFSKGLTLIPVGDMHLGSRACDERKLNALLKWVLNRDDTYVIGMGDYADLVIRQDLKRFSGTSVKEDLRDLLDSMLNEQTRMVVKLFKPLADAGKLLGLAMGNHEYEIQRHHSYDIMKEVCSQLQVPYLGYSFFYRLALRTEKSEHIRTCVIYGHHGYGSSRKPGAALNKLVDSIASYDADIILSGHDHHKLGNRHARLGVTDKGILKLVDKSVVLAKSGSFLRTNVIGDTTYSEKAGYPPNDMGVVRIDIRFTGADKNLDIHLAE